MVPLIRVIGSMNADISVTSRFPDIGETVRSASFCSSAGGKGANQAVACGRLSRPRPQASTPVLTTKSPPVDVQMCGSVSSLDPHYKGLLQPILEQSSGDLSLVRVKEDAQTGVSVIILSPEEGDNRIIFSPGANFTGMQLSPDIVGQALAAPIPDLIVMQRFPSRPWSPS